MMSDDTCTSGATEYEIEAGRQFRSKHRGQQCW
jgi:hypothetical protein